MSGGRGSLEGVKFGSHVFGEWLYVGILFGVRGQREFEAWEKRAGIRLY